MFEAIGVMLIFILICAGIGIFSTVFWILMIIHVAKHDVPNKTAWIIIIAITGIIGAIIYYFAVKKEFDMNNLQSIQAKPNSSTSSSQ